MTAEAKAELAEIKRDHELLEAMKKSAAESDKRMAERVQEYLEKHFGIAKGRTFTLWEVIEKASQ